jgi:hypothetical protein
MMPCDTYRLYQIERAKSPPKSAAPTSKRPGWHPPRHRGPWHHAALASHAEAIPDRNA